MPAEALRWSAQNCTIGRAWEIIGDKWTFLLLREVFLGIRRFDEIRMRTGIPRQVLTNRLARLVEQGLLRRQPYREPGARAREEYRLTERGLDLYPVLVALREWGDRYLADPDGPPMLTVHKECGAPVHTVLRCEAGHAVGSPRNVHAVTGPGARPRPSRVDHD